MKKFLVILLSVCLVVTFTSCSNEAKVDERVNVSFGVDQTRSLSSSAYYADFATLDWWYKATTSSQFDYGKREEWTKLEEGLDTILELSQGIWSFNLCAVATGDDPRVEDTTLVYNGSRSGVLVQRGTGAQNISIEVVPGGTGNGTIVISSNVVVNKKTESGYIASTEKANNWEVKAISSASNFTTQTGVFSGDKTITGVPAGDYTVKVWYKDVLDEEGTFVIRATEPIDISVYANSTITVTGSIDEETQAVVIKPISSYQAVASKDVSITSSDPVVFEIPVTPLMTSSANEKTTVTVPGALYSNPEGEGEVSVSVDVTVTPASESSINDSFTATTENGVVAAAIDLSLSIGETSVGSFNGETVKVETYVAKNLNEFSFCYPGETWTKKNSEEEVSTAKDYYYDSETGKLVFLADHFSTFIVETTSGAMIGDKAYDNLQEAYCAYQEGTIVLLKDVDLTNAFLIGKSVTIDGNGHNIYNTANRVIRITQPDLDVELYDLGVVSKCTDASDVRGISFDNTSTGSSLLLDGCTVSASFYAINVVNGVENIRITIKNSNVVGWAAINSYSKNSTFVVEGSVLKGINDKSESSWNNYATIVFDGLGNAIGQFGINNSLAISNSSIISSSYSSNKQTWLSIQRGAQNNAITLNSTKVLDGNNNDVSGNITIVPFVGYDSKKEKYAKSYDVHSLLVIDGEEYTICYSGENDTEALMEGGVYCPYEGCSLIQ